MVTIVKTRPPCVLISGAAPGPTSSAVRCTAFPPVGRRTLTNHLRGELDVREVTELPEFLRGTALLEDDLVGVEGIEFAGTKAVNSFGE
jgi:hypothetical protein